MKKNKLLEGKIWGAVTALASSILTELIYDTLSDTSYVLQMSGGQVQLVQQNGNILKGFGFILITFIVTWGFIAAVIPVVLRLIQRFHFRKIERYSKRELSEEFKARKAEVLSMEPVFSLETSDTRNRDLIKLKAAELAIIITDLHSIFSPPNAKLRQRIKYSFRNSEHSTIINIADRISDYEFLALISIMEQMVKKLEDINDEGNVLLTKDCKEMKEDLNDLRSICA